MGAVDGKHVVMQSPANAGSHYYNYKGTYSMALMAVAGPDYECVYADVGTNGRVSDGSVWNKCGLTKVIEDVTVVLPPPKCLPFGVQKLPYIFVGDGYNGYVAYSARAPAQHRWMCCANERNIVGPRFDDRETIEMLALVGSEV